MTMCMVCRRNLLVGERFRLWRPPSALGERPICVLCEEEAEQLGWGRLDRPLERVSSGSIWHARKVA